MLLDRRPRGEDPWLRFKVGAFTVGAVLALAGIYFESDWMIWLAMAALIAGFAVRFLGDRRADGTDESESTDSPAGRG